VSALIWAGVAFLGGLGALARFLVDRQVSQRFGAGFPLGTLVVNASGALLLGFLFGIALRGHAYLLAGTAVLGSYTTFSTWMLESQRLGEEGEGTAMAANIVVSIAAGLGGAALGRLIGGAL
jgi:fluoride exporter